MNDWITEKRSEDEATESEVSEIVWWGNGVMGDWAGATTFPAPIWKQTVNGNSEIKKSGVGEIPQIYWLNFTFSDLKLFW